MTPVPSLDDWLAEAKALPDADRCGMYLAHTGVVRASAKAAVREGASDTPPVRGMHFSYDANRLAAVVSEAKTLPGIYHVRVWLAEGELSVGDEIMRVLIGGDIRPHVVNALDHLVGRIKNECVHEEERY